MNTEKGNENFHGETYTGYIRYNGNTSTKLKNLVFWLKKPQLECHLNNLYLCGCIFKFL